MFLWDEVKSESNRRKHGLGFEAAYDFDWEFAVKFDCSRSEDKEERLAAVGWLNGKLYTIIHTYRNGQIRIISLRRANVKEEKFYGKKEF